MAPPTDAQSPGYISDPEAWRALAHPLRMRLLHELGRLDSARATDLCETLGQPANSVSFHLRQLARYGLIEPTESKHGDRREKWWRLTVTDSELLLDDDNDSPSSRQALRDVLEVSRRELHQQVDAWFDAASIFNDAPQDETHMQATNWDVSFDLTPEEWKQLKRELQDVIQHWRKRSTPSPQRRTYRHVAFGANRAYLDGARRQREPR